MVQIDLTISGDAPSISITMEEPKEDEVDFYYEIDPGYRVVAANSILTTVSGDDIKLDFVIESLALPKRMRQRLSADKSVHHIVEIDPNYRNVRNIQIGIFCSLEKAEAFADFIKSEVAKHKKSQKS